MKAALSERLSESGLLRFSTNPNRDGSYYFIASVVMRLSPITIHSGAASSPPVMRRGGGSAPVVWFIFVLSERPIARKSPCMHVVSFRDVSD